MESEASGAGGHFFSLLESLPENEASTDEAEPKEGAGENPVTSLKHLDQTVAEANTEINKLTPSYLSFFLSSLSLSPSFPLPLSLLSFSLSLSFLLFFLFIYFFFFCLKPF